MVKTELEHQKKKKENATLTSINNNKDWKPIAETDTTTRPIIK